MDFQKRNYPFIADDVILQVPVLDNEEPLIDARVLGGVQIGPSPEIDNNQDYTYMRKSVYERLLHAQSLLPQGVYFCLYEAYRSIALQKILFDERFMRIQAQHPHFNQDELFVETIRLVSPVLNRDGSENIPPHATGAAIDVYLVDEQGQPLDMGMHPKDWMEDVTGALSKTVSTVIAKEAQQNRDLMSSVLTLAGFINYPTEFWHWSYGDRYWAYMTHASHAVYGQACL